jgi:hypothetical protein
MVRAQPGRSGHRVAGGLAGATGEDACARGEQPGIWTRDRFASYTGTAPDPRSRSSEADGPCIACRCAGSDAQRSTSRTIAGVLTLCAAGCMTSARGCGAAATRPRPRCWPSTARWSTSRSAPSPMPVGSPSTPAGDIGKCATRAPGSACETRSVSVGWRPQRIVTGDSQCSRRDARTRTLRYGVMSEGLGGRARICPLSMTALIVRTTSASHVERRKGVNFRPALTASYGVDLLGRRPDARIAWGDRKGPCGLAGRLVKRQRSDRAGPIADCLSAVTWLVSDQAASPRRAAPLRRRRS